MASEREQPTSNDKDSQAESENLKEPTQSTDDYFENVNRRLKKKSRFGLGKPKKEAEPKKKKTPPEEVKVETPEPPVPIEEPKIEEIKIEEPVEPVIETEPLVEEVIEQQPETVEPETLVVEEQIETQPVEVNVVEQAAEVENVPEPEPIQPVEDSIYAAIPEITVEPSPVKEVKPKKKGFFSFLRWPRGSKPKLIETNQSVQTESPTDVQVNAPNMPEVPVNQEAAVQAQVVAEPVAAKENAEVETVDSQHLNGQAPFFDGIVHIGKYTKEVTMRSKEKAILCIGEYPVHLLLKSRFASRPDGVLPLFIDKSSQDIIKEGKNLIDPDHVIGLDTELDAHFWYNITPNVTKESPFLAKLDSKPVSQLQKALIVASIWDGVGSALLPTMTAEFEERKINSAALALFPSKVQSVESQFNAFAAVGKCALSGAAPIVLLDRDNIENYLGVDRKGNMIKGNTVINYLVDLMLSRDTFTDEFSELSKTFDSPIFTLMFGTGASLRVYGSIENILDTLLFKQFLSFDLSSSELLYVLTRVPYNLKDKVPRGKIEMAAANWFKDKATLKSIHVAEPVYVEDNSDRIDIALFVGGFNTTKIFSAIEKKVNTMKNRAVKKGFLQEDEWKEIVKKLTS